MTFPTTAVLDTFNRADENPLGNGNWSTIAPYDDGALKLVSNQAAMSGLITEYNGSYWSAATFGADCEAYVTIPTAPVATGRIYLNWRVANPTSATLFSGYTLELIKVNAGTDTLKVFRTDNAVDTQLGATINQEVSDGDALGISMVGATITVYYQASGGSWTALTTRSDSTYTGAGYIVLQIALGTLTRCDQFGGGTYIPPAAVLSRSVTAAGMLGNLSVQPTG